MESPFDEQPFLSDEAQRTLYTANNKHGTKKKQATRTG